VLLVCDTQVRHAINDGGYASRRSQCESAAAKMGVPSLREATLEMAARCTGLTTTERQRVRHVVGEIARTLDASAALQAGDYAAFGHLMVASHHSLRDDYHVSCEELDTVVESALAQKGVYGARMTGGGFGGSAIVLVAVDQAAAVTAAIAADFSRRFGWPCPIFSTTAAAGAGLVEAGDSGHRLPSSF
jgi:galactokinase